MTVISLGTFVVRIHKDQTVAKGDLLESNGDGTAKKQSGTAMLSSTIAKVTANLACSYNHFHEIKIFGKKNTSYHYPEHIILLLMNFPDNKNLNEELRYFYWKYVIRISFLFQ